MYAARCNCLTKDDKQMNKKIKQFPFFQCEVLELHNL